ncbi:MAG: 50S ribosomal protein L25, partial [Candidatus Omnitrophica bacterium]|nr:50S ribosomal protein L25 [Candidatus Omnitrophota bacterium]
MEEIILEAQLRQELGKSGVKDLREKGFVPAVVYGEAKDSQAIKLSHHELIQLLHQHRLENAIINLKIKDDKKAKARSCLIKEIQYHPVTGDILHLDFNEVSLTKVIKVNVPVVAKGEPIGVKQEGGSLEHILWEIEVECLPTDIPKEFSVDVSALKIGDDIHIKDISFPANIKVLNKPEDVVLSVAAPIKEEVPAAPLEGEEIQEPEVIKEKKEVAPEAEAAEETKDKTKDKTKEKEKEK